MRLYNINEYIELENIDESIVTVHMKGTQIHGEVQCIMCKNMAEHQDAKPKSVSYCCKANSKFWVTSNFASHLKSFHNLSALNAAPKQSSKRKAGTKNTNLSANEPIVTPEESEKAEVICMETDMSSKNDVVNWYDQVSKQITIMSHSVFSNGDIQNTVKLNDMDTINIKVVCSPQDGNCLFTSLAHQLYAHGMETKELSNKCIELRATVVKYIQQNVQSFEHEIKGRVYENIDNGISFEANQTNQLISEQNVHFSLTCCFREIDTGVVRRL